MTINHVMPDIGNGVAIDSSSFRASEAQHGNAYYQAVLDTGFRRYDDLDVDF